MAKRRNGQGPRGNGFWFCTDASDDPLPSDLTAKHRISLATPRFLQGEERCPLKLGHCSRQWFRKK